MLLIHQNVVGRKDSLGDARSSPSARVVIRDADGCLFDASRLETPAGSDGFM
jgi:hypothetical protein